jgi:hypothetical protein
MSERWAVMLPDDAAPHLGTLRLLPGLEVCQQPEAIWLRGENLEAVDTRLRGLPGARRYRRLADGQLVALEQRVPSARLPQGEWRPLAEWLRCVLPDAVWPGSRPARAQVRLVRSSSPAEANLLVLALDDWQAYAETAPQVRLERLSFALGAGRRVLVRGTPLPPLAGQRFVERAGIAVPAGWQWEPAVEAEVLRAALAPDAVAPGSVAGQGSLVLFTSPECDFERIPAEAFVRATRSAVRLSVEASLG